MPYNEYDFYPVVEEIEYYDTYYQDDDEYYNEDDIDWREDW